MKLIKNWPELEEYSKICNNPNYYIDFSDGRFSGEGQEISPHSAWIRPIKVTEETEKNYWDHNKYLSTHTFYGKNKDGTGRDTHKYSTELLQKFGFDVEIDNWDK